MITAAGVIAILAGTALYAGIWAGTGFSGPPRWYAMGGHVAIILLILAAAVAWPAANNLGALTRILAGQGFPATAEQNAERVGLINRLTLVTQINALLLVVTVALMAIGAIRLTAW